MMNYNLIILQNQVLEGERIILRPITLADAQDMYEYKSDEQTTRYIFDPHDDLARTFNSIANYYMKEPIGKYAIVLKEENKLIGTFEFRVKEHNKSGEIGYTLNSKYWGNGYMTEAGKLILHLAFNQLKLERVFAEHATNNPASGNVMKRLGMTCDGILRKNHMFKGELLDSAYYSILKDEYFRHSK